MDNKLNYLEKFKKISKFLNQFTKGGKEGLRFNERMPVFIAGSNKVSIGSTCFFGYIIETYVLNEELYIKVDGENKSDYNNEIREYRFTLDTKGIYEQNQYTILELRDNFNGNNCMFEINKFEILSIEQRLFSIYF